MAEEDPETGPPRWQRVGRSILNGVCGDHLSREGSPLAIEMDFYSRGMPVEVLENCSNKVVVLLHGLTNLETIWNFPDSEDNYGLRLQRNQGYTPLFLRYNTGLSLDENGRLFVAQMTELVEAYPIPIDEILWIGFSMGGLVMRVAQQVAQEEDSPWLSKLIGCFYLGTPHLGSPIEKAGHLVASLIGSFPVELAQRLADWIELRSQGIQDLRFGLDASQGYHPGARHFFVSGALSEANDSLVNRTLGDSLVRQPSASPVSAPEGSLSAHFDGLSHFPLAYSDSVYTQLEEWVQDLEGSVSPVFSSDSGRLVRDRTVAPGRAMAAGVLHLVHQVGDEVVEVVEGVHQSISRLSHRGLQTIPVIAPVSRLVETIHDGISGTVYESVRLGGDLVGMAAEILAADPTDSTKGSQGK